MGHKTRIMYVERKPGHLAGPARIGRVRHSKTGAAIYHQGKEFKRAGFKATTTRLRPASNIGYLVREEMPAMCFRLPMFRLKEMTMLRKATGAR